jgi:hypothetical protein
MITGYLFTPWAVAGTTRRDVASFRRDRRAIDSDALMQEQLVGCRSDIAVLARSGTLGAASLHALGPSRVSRIKPTTRLPGHSLRSPLS